MQPFLLEVKFQSGLGIKVLRLKLVFKNLILFCVMSGSGLRVDRDCCLHCILFSTNPQDYYVGYRSVNLVNGKSFMPITCLIGEIVHLLDTTRNLGLGNIYKMSLKTQKHSY